MPPACAVGDDVLTPFGKAVVREVRTGGRLLVDIGGRKVVVGAASVKPAPPARKLAHRRARPVPHGTSAEEDAERHAAPAEVDLHGLFVADALARVESAINEALLAGRLQLRIIHGRGGGRIKSAVHQQLRALPPVRSFRLDPGNPGVTIAEL